MSGDALRIPGVGAAQHGRDCDRARVIRGQLSRPLGTAGHVATPSAARVFAVARGLFARRLIPVVPPDRTHDIRHHRVEERDLRIVAPWTAEIGASTRRSRDAAVGKYE